MFWNVEKCIEGCGCRDRETGRLSSVVVRNPMDGVVVGRWQGSGKGGGRGIGEGGGE
jgi:hypothetical protein